MRSFRWVTALVACGLGSMGCGDQQAPATDAPPGIDAGRPIDAGVDSPPPLARYDVGYIDEHTIPYNYTGVGGMVLIVNKSEKPLSMAKASVVSVTSDRSDVTCTLALDPPSTTLLPPNHVAGLLSQQAALELVNSGLVPEPIDDDMMNFEIGFASFPPIGIDVHARATIRIGDADLVLPFTIHVVSGDRTNELNHAVRIGTP